MRYSFAPSKLIFSIVVMFVSSVLVTAQNPVPFLSQPLIPAATLPAGGPFMLIVDGTGFVPGATLNWNGEPRTTLFANRSRLAAFIPSSDIAKPTTAWITVTNPSPGGGTSNTLWLPVNRPASRLSFQRHDYHAGVMPASPTAFDVNRDGTLDIAVPINDNGAGQVLFMLGNGEGTFRYGEVYQMGWGTTKPIFGDFDRDGVVDLAISVHSPSAMAVLLGRGEGTFGSPAYYPTGSAPGADLTADFNGDGKLDLETINQADSSTVSILLGNGDGTFQPHVDYPAGFPTALATGDFNRDGKLDLAVAVYGSWTVAVLLGNGDGTFRPAVDYAAGGCPGGIMTADLNGDGRLDLAVPNQCEENVSILLGNGEGTFRPQVKYPTAEGAVRLDVADFNADGKLDLAVETYADTVDILLGNGDGTFHAPASFAVATYPFGIAVADFNGDGRMEVVTTSYNEDSISVLIAQPDQMPDVRAPRK